MAAGEADAMLRNATVVRLNEPLVPIIVTGKFPTGEFADVVKVSVEEPPGATVPALKPALTPCGRPDALRFTEPLKLEAPLTPIK